MQMYKSGNFLLFHILHVYTKYNVTKSYSQKRNMLLTMAKTRLRIFQRTITQSYCANTKHTSFEPNPKIKYYLIVIKSNNYTYHFIYDTK